jgi:hypothetical protein
MVTFKVGDRVENLEKGLKNSTLCREDHHFTVKGVQGTVVETETCSDWQALKIQWDDGLHCGMDNHLVKLVELAEQTFFIF